jgi:hypothetical protein
MLFMDNLLGKIVLKFCDAQKLHECTFMPFSVVEWVNIDVFGFYTFERLEYQIFLSFSKKPPPP